MAGCSTTIVSPPLGLCLLLRPLLLLALPLPPLLLSSAFDVDAAAAAPSGPQDSFCLTFTGPGAVAALAEDLAATDFVSAYGISAAPAVGQASGPWQPAASMGSQPQTRPDGPRGIPMWRLQSSIRVRQPLVVDWLAVALNLSATTRAAPQLRMRLTACPPPITPLTRCGTDQYDCADGAVPDSSPLLTRGWGAQKGGGFKGAASQVAAAGPAGVCEGGAAVTLVQGSGGSWESAGAGAGREALLKVPYQLILEDGPADAGGSQGGGGLSGGPSQPGQQAGGPPAGTASVRQTPAEFLAALTADGGGGSSVFAGLSGGSVGTWTLELSLPLSLATAAEGGSGGGAGALGAPTGLFGLGQVGVLGPAPAAGPFSLHGWELRVCGRRVPAVDRLAALMRNPPPPPPTSPPPSSTLPPQSRPADAGDVFRAVNAGSGGSRGASIWRQSLAALLRDDGAASANGGASELLAAAAAVASSIAQSAPQGSLTPDWLALLREQLAQLAAARQGIVGGGTDYGIDRAEYLGLPAVVQIASLCSRDLYLCYNRYVVVPPPADLPQDGSGGGGGGGGGSGGGGGGGGGGDLAQQAPDFGRWVSSFENAIRQAYDRRAAASAERFMALQQAIAERVDALSASYPQFGAQAGLVRRALNARLYSAAYRSAAVSYASAYLDSVIGLLLYGKPAELAINPRYILTRLLLILIDGVFGTVLVGITQATFTITPDVINPNATVISNNSTGTGASITGGGPAGGPVLLGDDTGAVGPGIAFPAVVDEFRAATAAAFTRTSPPVNASFRSHSDPVAAASSGARERLREALRRGASGASASICVGVGEDGVRPVAAWLGAVEAVVAAVRAALRPDTGGDSSGGVNATGSGGGDVYGGRGGLTEGAMRSGDGTLQGGGSREAVTVRRRAVQAYEDRLRHTLSTWQTAVERVQTRVGSALDDRQAALDRTAVRMANITGPGPAGAAVLATINRTATVAASQLTDRWSSLRQAAAAAASLPSPLRSPRTATAASPAGPAPASIADALAMRLNAANAVSDFGGWGLLSRGEEGVTADLRSRWDAWAPWNTSDTDRAASSPSLTPSSAPAPPSASTSSSHSASPSPPVPTPASIFLTASGNSGGAAMEVGGVDGSAGDGGGRGSGATVPSGARDQEVWRPGERGDLPEVWSSAPAALQEQQQQAQLSVPLLGASTSDLPVPAGRGSGNAWQQTSTAGAAGRASISVNTNGSGGFGAARGAQASHTSALSQEQGSEGPVGARGAASEDQPLAWSLRNPRRGGGPLQPPPAGAAIDAFKQLPLLPPLMPSHLSQLNPARWSPPTSSSPSPYADATVADLPVAWTPKGEDAISARPYLPAGGTARPSESLPLPSAVQVLHRPAGSLPVDAPSGGRQAHGPLGGAGSDMPVRASRGSLLGGQLPQQQRQMQQTPSSLGQQPKPQTRPLNQQEQQEHGDGSVWVVNGTAGPMNNPAPGEPNTAGGDGGGIDQHLRYNAMSAAMAKPGQTGLLVRVAVQVVGRVLDEVKGATECAAAATRRVRAEADGPAGVGQLDGEDDIHRADPPVGLPRPGAGDSRGIGRGSGAGSTAPEAGLCAALEAAAAEVQAAVMATVTELKCTTVPPLPGTQLPPPLANHAAAASDSAPTTDASRAPVQTLLTSLQQTLATLSFRIASAKPVASVATAEAPTAAAVEAVGVQHSPPTGAEGGQRDAPAAGALVGSVARAQSELRDLALRAAAATAATAP